MAASQTIAQVHQSFDGYVLDPHTAVGVTIAGIESVHPHLVVCMACAHPFKFEKTITESLGQLPPELAAKEHPHPSVASAMKLKSKAPGMLYWPQTENWEMNLRRILQEIDCNNFEPQNQ